MFKYPFIASIDTKENYGEERWIGIGQIKNLTIVVIYTEYDTNMIRLISARKATKREKKYYEEKCFR